MSRESRMDAFIKEAQSAGAHFINMLIGKCPETIGDKDAIYMHNEIQRDIALFFDNALESAKEADSPHAYTDYQENLDREHARGMA